MDASDCFPHPSSLCSLWAPEWAQPIFTWLEEGHSLGPSRPDFLGWFLPPVLPDAGCPPLGRRVGHLNCYVTPSGAAVNVLLEDEQGVVCRTLMQGLSRQELADEFHTTIAMHISAEPSHRCAACSPAYA